MQRNEKVNLNNELEWVHQFIQFLAFEKQRVVTYLTLLLRINQGFRESEAMESARFKANMIFIKSIINLIWSVEQLSTF